MTTIPYRAFVYADLDVQSVQKLNTLTPAQIADVTTRLMAAVLAGPGTAPTGSPWVGNVTLDAAGGVPKLTDVHAIVDTLVADWNGKYTLQLRSTQTGPNAGDYPRNETWRWVIINGWPVLVPNHTLFRAPTGDTPFDPLTLISNNHGLSGRLRIEVRLFEPT